MANEIPHRKNRLGPLLLGCLVSGFFLFLLLGKLDLSDVWREIGQVHPGRLVLALVPGFFGFLAMAGRSATLFQPLVRLPFPTLFKSVLVSYAGNNVLPFRMGELLRVDYLARQGQVPHSSCLAILAVERLLDVVCLVALFFGLATLVVNLPSIPALALLAGGVGTALVVLFLVGRDPKRWIGYLGRVTAFLPSSMSDWLIHQASRFAAGLAVLGSPKRMLGAASFSVGYWFSMMAGVLLILWAFDLTLPWYAPAVVLVFVTFGGMLPSTPAFVGTFHYFSSLALTFLGVDPTLAASFAIVQHAAGVVPWTLFSFAVLFGDYLRGDLVWRRRA